MQRTGCVSAVIMHELYDLTLPTPLCLCFPGMTTQTEGRVCAFTTPAGFSLCARTSVTYCLVVHMGQHDVRPSLGITGICFCYKITVFSAGPILYIFIYNFMHVIYLI